MRFSSFSCHFGSLLIRRSPTTGLLTSSTNASVFHYFKRFRMIKHLSDNDTCHYAIQYFLERSSYRLQHNSCRCPNGRACMCVCVWVFVLVFGTCHLLWIIIIIMKFYTERIMAIKFINTLCYTHTFVSFVLLLYLNHIRLLHLFVRQRRRKKDWHEWIE